jgi:shikimate 5-dehydrogenase
MRLNTETKIYLSIARNGGKNGVFFYNNLFSFLKINAVYLSVSPTHIEDFRKIFSFCGIEGAAVASPFKMEVASFLDKLTQAASETYSINSVRKLESGELIGHNTDLVGFKKIIDRLSCLTSSSKIVVYGAGGVVPSVLIALRKVAPECEIMLQVREPKKAEGMIQKFGVECVTEDTSVVSDLFVNAVPYNVGTHSKIVRLSKNTRVLFDLNPIQEKFDLDLIAQTRGQDMIRGFNLYLEQLKEQFCFFTGNEIDMSILEDIAETRKDS